MPRFCFLVGSGDVGSGGGADPANLFSRLGVYGTGCVLGAGGGAMSTLVPNCTSKVGPGGCCTLAAGSRQAKSKLTARSGAFTERSVKAPELVVNFQ